MFSLVFAPVFIIVIFLLRFVAASFGLSATPRNFGRPYAPTLFATAKKRSISSFSEPFEVNNVGCFYAYYLPVYQFYIGFFHSVAITRKTLLGFGGAGKEKGCIYAPILYLKYVGYSE